MGIREIQEEIIRLKKEKDICILAHCYQTPEILEVADFDRFLNVKEVFNYGRYNLYLGGRHLFQSDK